jgi:hypothetical protein
VRKILMLSALAAYGDSHHATPRLATPPSLCQPAPLSTALTIGVRAQLLY